MNNLSKFIIIYCISIFCASCAILNRPEEAAQKQPSSVISNGSEQLAYMYNPSVTKIHPRVFVRKNNMQNIDLYVIINDSELLFSKANAKNQNIAKVRIFYKIMESYENTALIDSCQRIVTFNKTETPKTYAVKMNVKNVDLQQFVIQTTVTDVFRGKMNISFCDVDKTDGIGVDNFMVSKVENLQPYADNYLKVNDFARIENLNQSPNGLTKTYFEAVDEFPVLPYESDPAEEDSTYFSNSEKEQNALIINPKSKGIYYFSSDTTQKNGLVIPCFSDEYPNITSLEDLAKPLEYLTSPEEFSKITNAEHKKLAIDDFWYSCTKDVSKAKELIKVYYTRSVFANIYFYDFREGMLTDRGMVYIVLGPPKILAITSKSEIWTYVDSQNGNKVKFIFRKEPTAFAHPQYQLYRSTEFKPYWDNAVQTWRKGKIFAW